MKTGESIPKKGLYEMSEYGLVRYHQPEEKHVTFYEVLNLRRDLMRTVREFRHHIQLIKLQ